MRRIHQEDVCQALAVMPHLKHQNQGGPSAIAVMDLIRRHSAARDADALRFLDALILNWLIAGTDAHAKNYSLLIGAGGRGRLAPLHDLSSALPYPQQVYPRHAAMALRIGWREWRRAAGELRLDEGVVLARLKRMSELLPDLAGQVQKRLKSQGIKHSVIIRLVAAVRERVAVQAVNLPPA